MPALRIGLIGDFNLAVTAHRVIPKVLMLAANAISCEVDPIWLPTDEIILNDVRPFTGFAGLWCVPASPYASEDGAFWAIRVARETQIPFLGTCGGFQHALIEYARNVAGIRDAEHAETNPTANCAVISALACSLVEETGSIRLRQNSLIRDAYGCERITESYHCRFGLNHVFQERLENANLQFTGRDENGEARVFELRGHPFFVATLFQPERAALQGEAHPLIRAFIAAALRQTGSAALC